jgi:beta-N-acetylhexosaminidase
LGKELWSRFSGATVAVTAMATLMGGSAGAVPAVGSQAAGQLSMTGHRAVGAHPHHAANGVLLVVQLDDAAAASAANESLESAVVSAMSPRQLAGQRVIYGYSGITPPAALLSLISQGQVGGVIFFSGNYRSRSQFTAAVKKLEAANAAATNPARDYPLLLMTDQEGGLVNRLPGAPGHSEKWIGARGTAAGRAAQARAAGAGAGTNLRSYGLNVDLAPVLDVFRTAGDFDDQFQRSYSMNPQIVATLGANFIRALQGAGVAAAAKHFPGLGAATASQNTDQRPVTIRLSKTTLESDDEYPYQSAVSANVDLVMVSWARYPQLGSSLPAGLSWSIVQGELRSRLGFRGVTITDAIGAGALTPYGSTQNRALMAAEAGMQLLLASDSVGQATQCVTALGAAYRNGKLPRPAFRATVGQILALRASLQG